MKEDYIYVYIYTAGNFKISKIGKIEKREVCLSGITHESGLFRSGNHYAYIGIVGLSGRE